MTREEQIQKLIDEENGIDNYGSSDYQVGVLDGARLADEHPKSPWISVKDDLPCNHKELLLSTGYHTVTVFTYKKGGACGMDNMIVRNGKWEWEAWKENYLYWMPIPNLPEE